MMLFPLVQGERHAVANSGMRLEAAFMREPHPSVVNDRSRRSAQTALHGNGSLPYRHETRIAWWLVRVRAWPPAAKAFRDKVASP
jgi:hypothetical protein